SNLIYKADGSEDKDASRRIEIKFSIKNDKGIKELEKFLKMK
ncbi:MAG: OmpA family protein, partial [Campylobacterota bacterium]|nr:OmpA family protein [Campylobacterota bacterium]